MPHADPLEFVARLREQGVRLNIVGPQRIRAVTHIEITPNEVRRAGQIVCELASGIN